MGFLAAQNSYRATGATGLANADYSSALQTALNGGLTPNAGIVDSSQANQTAAQQQQLVQALTAAYQGNGPSLAGGQLQGATNQNVANTAAQIAGIKGINPAAAARLIAENGANQNQNAALQSAQTKIQEQQNAEGNLGNVLGTERGQDINQAQGNTSLGIQNLNANTNAAGTVGGLQNQQNNTQVQNALGQQQINAGVTNANTSNANNLFGGIISGAAGLGASLLGAGSKAAGAAHGEKVPGKAKVKGDSAENDTVPTMLSPGETVIPRSVKTGEQAKEFFQAVKEHAKKGASTEGKGKGYAKVLAAHRAMSARVSELEKLCYGGMVN